MHRAVGTSCASHVNGHAAYSTARIFSSYNSCSRRTFTVGLSLGTPVKYLHAPDRFPRGIQGQPSGTRQWSFKSQQRAPEFVHEVPDNQEDAARAAILDKVMKGRQPTDLMLRCELASIPCFLSVC